MENIKKFIGFCLGIALIFVSWLCFEGVRLLQTSRQLITNNQEQLTSTVKNINSASKALEQSSLAVKEVSEAQQKLLTDKKTQDGIALLLRQGNDLAHTVTKVNVILDKVNRETIPKVNTTLDSTNTIINTSNDVVIKLANRTELILKDTDLAVRDLRQLLTDPNVKRAIEGLADTSEAASRSAFHIQVTAQEIQAAIPELIKSFQSVANNADLSSQEVTTFLTGLNKPLTRKQKVFRFVLEAVIKSSPALLRR